MGISDGKWYGYQSIKSRRETWGQSGYKAVFAPWAFWVCVYTPVLFGFLPKSKWLWAKALCVDPKAPRPEPMRHPQGTVLEKDMLKDLENE